MFITNILIISLKPEFYSLSQNMFLYHVAFAFFDSAIPISATTEPGGKSLRNLRTFGQAFCEISLNFGAIWSYTL